MSHLRHQETALFLCVLWCSATGPDAFLLESLFRNDAWMHLSAPVSEENEVAVYRSMIDGCR